MISVVIPVYNEVTSLDALATRLLTVGEELSESYEIVFVDDGSTEPTLSELIRISEANEGRSNIRIVELSRNFGKEHAIVAGIDHAQGGTVIIMDGDLQHPPEKIKEMNDLATEGYEVVQARRRDRVSETWMKRNFAKIFYWLFSKLSDARVGDGLGDFILIKGGALKAFSSLREQSRFNKGLYGWLGFRHAEVTYQVEERVEGQSHWPIMKLIRYGLRGLLSFSNMPLRAILTLGVIVSIGAMLFGFWVVGRAIISGIAVPGYTSLMFFILFLGGVNLFCLGVVGAYVGEIFELAKRRPLYIVRNIYE